MSSSPQVIEPRWGFEVYRTDWDTAFAENERLPAGTKASWDLDSEHWFPKELSGSEEADPSRYFSSVMRTLDDLCGVLREAGKVEDLLGGMTVG